MRQLSNFTTPEESLRVFKAAVEQAQDAILITTSDLEPPGPQIVFVNEAFTRMTGYEAEDVIGKTPRILQGDKTERSVLDRLREVLLKGETFVGETVNYRKDGTEFYVSWRIDPLRDENGKITQYVSIQNDITERMQIEAKLRDSEERFRQLAENIREVFWVSAPDLEESIYVSPAFETVWGRSSESVIQNPKLFLETLHPEDRNSAFENFMFNRDKETEYEYRIIRPDGSIRWIWDRAFPIKNHEGKVYRVVGIAEDITERKLANIVLQESEERFRKLLQDLQVGVFVFGRQGKVLLYNSVALKILGLAEEDVLGKSALEYEWDAIHEDGSPYLTEEYPLLKAFETRQSMKSLVAGVRRQDTKERIWLLVDTIPQYAVDGSLGQIICTFTDFTEHKKEREMRLQLLRRLVNTQEEERRHIARELHDQLGQYSAALMMELKSLQKLVGDNLPLQDCVVKLRDLTTRFSQDVRRFTLELRPTALDDLGLHHALTNYINEWSERSSIKVDFHNSGLLNKRLSFDVETALYRLVQEALSNVLKHAQATNVSVIIENRKNRLLAIVEDDGKGFDITETIKTPTPERGLGLIGMRERIESVGGTLEIESARGKGTTIVARILNIDKQQDTLYE